MNWMKGPYLEAIRSGLVAGALNGIFTISLYLLGRDAYISPLHLVGIPLIFGFLFLRVKWLRTKGKVLLTLGNLFIFFMLGFSLATLTNDTITYLILTQVDPALNNELIVIEVKAAKAYYESTGFPKEKLKAALEQVALQADLTEVSILAKNYLEELFIGLCISGLLGIFTRRRTDEDEAIEKEVDASHRTYPIVDEGNSL
jgi:hypothetical protein